MQRMLFKIFDRLGTFDNPCLNRLTAILGFSISNICAQFMLLVPLRTRAAVIDIMIKLSLHNST